MSKLARVTMVAIVGLALAGCVEGSAREAVEKAEGQVSALRDQAQKIAPDRLQALDDSLAGVKSRLESGDYRSVVMSARSISAQARDLEANMDNTKSQLETAFSSAAGEIPAQLEQALARISEIAGMRRLPSSVNAASFEALKTESATWNDAWAKAKADFDAGNLAQAMSAANALRAKIREATALIGT